MRKLALSIGLALAAAFAAQAQNVGIPYTLTANGTAKATTALAGGVALSDTNWVQAVGMIVTVPALSTGTVEITHHVLGTNAPAAWSQRLVNLKATTEVRYLTPAYGSATGDKPLLLYGTNALMSVTKTGANTNTWPIVLLIDQ